MKVQKTMKSSIMPYNVTFQYFLPPFFTFISETLMNMSVKTSLSQHRLLVIVKIS